MKQLTIHNFIVKLSLLLLTGIWSCSAEKTNIISTTYHNTTAKYNAYYYAKERIREIETGIENSHQNNYDFILKVFHPFDSTNASTYRTQIEDCIKKASIAINNHKNSKWVDDSYNLMGLARLYGYEFESAIKTFKWVNVKSDDDDARHRALVHLLRTFTKYGEFNNAQAVSDHLEKEKLNHKNLRHLYQARAYLYQELEDLDKMVSNLVLAAPLLSKKDGKARTYFMIGQVYQELNFEAEAYSNYKKVLTFNPPYELSFYAKLYMAQVTQLSKNNDLRRIRKYFRKLIADDKNEEFKDKIYYELAEFEIKQGNLEMALENYMLSTTYSISNQRQKGLSYLKLGMIYYDTLANFELAEAYYDSAINVLPKDYEGYTDVKARQEILADFVTQLNTITLQDSLLLLANLDSAKVVSFFENKIREDRKREEEEKNKKGKRRSSNGNTNTTFNRPQNTGISSSASNWYFNNLSAISLGKNDFLKKWGNRPLEDNWRRSNKESSTNISSVNSNQRSETISQVSSEELTENAILAEVASVMKKIPFQEADKQGALDLIEAALYNLGKIYRLNLNENDNAALTFESLLERFPNTENKPEVLYTLYLIYTEKNDAAAEKFKRSLIREFPKTTFARLLVNPNYTEESSRDLDQLKIIYHQAYTLFKNEAYDEAKIELRIGIDKYPDVAFIARLKLLEVMILGKTDDLHNYKYELDKFIEEYPDTEVTPFAKALLQASDEYQKLLISRFGIKFIEDFRQPHYFILVYSNYDDLSESLPGELENYNESMPEDNYLTVGNLVFDENKSMVLVTEFPSKSTATAYLNAFIENNQLLISYPNAKFDTFVITKDNFNIFYQTKALEPYLKFFDDNY